MHLVANDDTMATSRAALVVILRLTAALGAVRVPASRATTVELDARAGASDAVALASTAQRSAGDGARGGRVAAARAAGAERRDVGFDIGVGVFLFRRVGDLLGGEAGGELLHRRLRELLRADLAGLLGLVRARGDDLGLLERTTLGDVGRSTTRMTRRRLGLSSSSGGGRRLASGDVEGVELAASGGLGDGLAGRVVGDVVAVNDVVVPVALALLDSRALEAESALPASRLGRVLGQRELAVVVVPGAEQVDGLDVGRSAEGEVELNGGHCDGMLVFEIEMRFRWAGKIVIVNVIIRWKSC